MLDQLSRFYDIPYYYRLLMVVGILSAVAYITQIRHRNAAKWKEYCFWMLTGLAGALFAIGNDLIISSISPEYFTIGKGLDSHGTPSVSALAFEAGFPAGIVVGGFYLMANNPNPDVPQLPYSKLIDYLKYPLLLAIVFALIAGSINDLDPFGLKQQVEFLKPAEKATRFLLVSRIHLGLYAGALVGTIAGLVSIRKTRRRT